MWHTGDGMGWWMIFGSVWFVFFWALIIWVVFRAIEARPGRSREPDDSPSDIARRRYARGEISREEFERLRQDLER